MAEIPLNGRSGLVTLVDDEDAPRVATKRWYAMKPARSSTVYVRAMEDGKTILLHRFIVGLDDPLLCVDHINRNGLDNRRSNLRVCTKSENSRYLGEAMAPLREHVHRVTARGRDYYYWQPGRGTPLASARIRLSGDPNSTEFWEQVRNLNAARLGKSL